jgi:hypothetical protein
MVKKPEELKKAFSNGAIPTEADFGDLIDSFIPRDLVTDAELQALREMLDWWRTQGANAAAGGGASAPAPASAGTAAAAQPNSAPANSLATAHASPATTPSSADVPVTAPASTQPSGAATVVSASNLTVAADGKWYALPITTGQSGTWVCIASTVNARAGYRISNHAIASAGNGGKRLVQNVERDSIIPWHTLQFAWQPLAGGTQFQLNLRARGAFGPDSGGKPTQIQCRITRQD